MISGWHVVSGAVPCTELVDAAECPVLRVVVGEVAAVAEAEVVFCFEGVLTAFWGILGAEVGVGGFFDVHDGDICVDAMVEYFVPVDSLEGLDGCSKEN